MEVAAISLLQSCSGVQQQLMRIFRIALFSHVRLQEGEGRRVAKIGTVFDISAVLGKNDDDILSDAEDMCDRMITADPMRLHQLLLFLHTCAAVALFPTGCAEVVIQ